MKVAIVGGTHGNEACGVEVIKVLKNNPPLNSKHEFQVFHGNPKAFELQKRYVDTDLNRAFGKHGIRSGYEEKRVQELESQIKGKFDFVVDLHTTTCNMGTTIIINSADEISRQAVAFMQNQIPDLRIIEEEDLGEDSVNLNRLGPSSFSIECGPVAHNILSANIVFNMRKILELLLSWDPTQKMDLSKVVYFKQYETIPYPEGPHWLIHSHIDGMDFEPVQPGAPLFVNHKMDVITYQGPQETYPFFINEASYKEKNIAMILASRETGWDL